MRLHTRRVFDLDGGLLRFLPEQADRKILRNRLSEYLSGRRRGRLRLPGHFPPEVLRLRDMSKTQIRISQYWVKPDTDIHHRLSKSVVNWIHQVAPGFLWTRTTPSVVLEANRVAVPRLGKTDVPRLARAQWPSTPTFSEMLVTSRTGKLLPVRDNFKSLSVPNCLTLRELNESHVIATRIVRQQIVGIRAEIEVPRKFLRYFRYRYGFLILSVRHCLPIGLVRFLLAQWIKCPNSLWLLEPVRLKFYLRRHTFWDFIPRQVLQNAIDNCNLELFFGQGKPTSQRRSEESLQAAIDEEFDQAMFRRFGLDPALL